MCEGAEATEDLKGVLRRETKAEAGEWAGWMTAVPLASALS